jgi:3D (Asp-Asp-Asp) domain-containing protein
MGLAQYTKVEIDGLPGEYIGLDKMNKRWEKKIDIYMGTDVKEALEWGVKKVKISWKTKQ